MVGNTTSTGRPRADIPRRAHLGKLRVLVADRNRRTALLVKRILVSLGFRDLDITTSGEEALEYLAKQPYDMIITEWEMDPIDGVTMVKAIRTAQADARIRRDIPILMLTARADVESVIDARDAGITEFVAKPFSAKTISHRIIQIIDHPRAFIDSPRYVGPDRRRRGVPPEGVEERRNRTPKTMPPNTSIRDQLGGLAATDIITDAAVNEAQAELVKAESEFIDWARADILILRQSFSGLSDTPSEDSAKQRLMNAAYAIKSEAGIFGYDLGTQVASLLLSYVSEHQDFSADALVVIGKHIDAIEIVFKEKIKQSGQGIAAEIVRSLQELIDKKG